MTERKTNRPRRAPALRLRTFYLSEEMTGEQEEDVTGRLGEFVMDLLSFQTPASAALAVEVYRACCRAWEANRRDVYGELNMVDERERRTVKCHVALLDALDRPPRDVAEVPDERPDELPRDNVVDLSCWAQSHPRPIRSLMFQEKGGER